MKGNAQVLQACSSKHRAQGRKSLFLLLGCLAQPGYEGLCLDLLHQLCCLPVVSPEGGLFLSYRKQSSHGCEGEGGWGEGTLGGVEGGEAEIGMYCMTEE